MYCDRLFVMKNGRIVGMGDVYKRQESRINKMNIRKVENLFEALEPHPTKLLMTGDPADMLKAENELSPSPNLAPPLQFATKLTELQPSIFFSSAIV